MKFGWPHSLIALFGGLILVQAASAERYPEALITQKSECLGAESKEYDYSSRFPSLRDQGAFSSCWMFEYASLYGELLCVEDEAKCKADLSPISAAFATWSEPDANNGDLNSIGGTPDIVFNGMLKRGLCEERDEPYREMIGPLLSFISNSKQKELNGISDSNLESYAAKLQHHYANHFNPGTTLSAKDLREWKQYGGDPGAFLISAFESETCKANLLKATRKYDLNLSEMDSLLQLKRKKGGTQTYLTRASSTAEKIRNQLASGFSAGVGLDTSDQYGGHAIVIAGLRWNPTRNRCEYFVRNSGWKRNLNGWQNANEILPMVYAIEGFKTAEEVDEPNDDHP